MKKLVAAAVLLLLAGSVTILGAAGFQTWSADQRAANHTLDGLPAPGSATAAMRRDDVVVGAGVLKSTALGGSVQIATPGVDYLAPNVTAAGNYDRVSVAASGLVTGGATLVVADVTALEALTGANYRDGQRVFVQTFGRDFVLRTTNAMTVDHLTVASVSGASGARWLSDTANRGHWTTATYYVKNDTGSDEADCLTSITPCKTMQELARRQRQREVTGTMTINALADIPDTDIAGFDFSSNGVGFSLTIQGDQTVVATGTIASVTAPSYGANTLNQGTITGFNPATYVGHLVRLGGTSGATGTYSAIVASPSAGVARFGIFTVNGATSSAGFTNGQTVEVIAGTKLPSIHIMGSAVSLILNDVTLSRTGTAVQLQNRTNGVIACTRCNVAGSSGLSFIGSAVTLVTSAWRGSPAIVPSLGATRVAMVDVGSISTAAATAPTFSDSIFYGSRVLGADYGQMSFTGTIGCGFFGLTAGLKGVTAGRRGSVRIANTIFGSGNDATSYIFDVGWESAYFGAFPLYPFLVESGSGGWTVGGGFDSTVDAIPHVAIDAGQAMVGVRNLANAFGINAASTLVLPGISMFSKFIVVGPGTVNFISIGALGNGMSRLGNGEEIELVISTGPVTFVSHAGALPAGATELYTYDSGTSVIAAGSRIRFRYTKYGATAGSWQEIWRSTATGDLAGELPAPTVAAIHETSGPTKLTIGAIANNALTKRSGTTFIGATAGVDYAAAGNYITAVTGDGTATGPGSVPFTLATVNGNVGSFTNASITVNGKGLITAASSGSAPALASRTLTAGAGMTGGGDLSADRTFNVVANADGTIVVNSNDIQVGTLVIGNIPNSLITYAKIQDVTTDRFLCRDTAGSGVVEECQAGTGLAWTGTPGLRLADTAVTPGAYTNANVTVDQQGRITSVANGSAGGGGTVTSVSGTATRISVATGTTTPVIDLVNTAVVAGSYTYTTLTVDAAGRLTAASNGTAPAPTSATFITQTPNATLTNEQALSALASGVLESLTTTGVASTFAVGGARVPHGSGANGHLTDAAELKFNGQTFGLGSLQELQIYNASTSATALAGLRVGTDAAFTNGMNFGMTGTNWVGGALATNAGLIEIAAGTSPMVISNYAGGKISFTTGTGRTERMAIAAGGNVSVANLATGRVDVAAGVLTTGTWPTVNRFMYSGGTTAAPAGDPGFTIDTGDDLIAISDGNNLGIFGLGSSYGGTYESLNIGWSGTAYSIDTSTSGGTVRAILVKSLATTGGPSGTGGVTIDDHLNVNGFAAATNDAFGVAHNTSGNRDHVKFYVGGGAIQDTTSNTLLDIIPSNTAVGTGNNGGVLSTVRIRSLVYTGSGTPTEATSLFVDVPSFGGPTGSTYAVHVAGGKTRLGGAVQLDAMVGPGELAADSSGNVSLLAFGASATKHDYYASIQAASALAGGVWIPTASSGFASIATAIEYPNDFVAGHVQATLNIISQSGFSDPINCSVTRNGSTISATVFSFSIGFIANGVYANSITTTGSGSLNDTYGFFCHYPGGTTTGATMTFTTQVVLTP